MPPCWDQGVFPCHPFPRSLLPKFLKHGSKAENPDIAEADGILTLFILNIFVCVCVCVCVRVWEPGKHDISANLQIIMGVRYINSFTKGWKCGDRRQEIEIETETSSSLFHKHDHEHRQDRHGILLLELAACQNARSVWTWSDCLLSWCLSRWVSAWLRCHQWFVWGSRA